MSGSVTAAASLPIELATAIRRARRMETGTRDCVLEAQLEATPAAGRRILRALQGGSGEFVISSVDGDTTARIRLTVTQVSTTEHSIGSRRIVVDWTRGTVTNAAHRISLSRTELRLLAALLDGQGQTMKRAELIERVWPGDKMDPSERENSLGVYICALRKRLSAIGAGDALCTVRRVGYRVNL